MLTNIAPVLLSVEYDGPMFFLLGPVAGIAFYTWVYLRYRNTDKRHAYEYKTISEVRNAVGSDQKVSAVRGVRNSSIPGGNSRNARQRLGNATTIVEVKEQ